MRNNHIIIITGLSGSGKSTAIAAFEDAGFYCVDNMPVVLLPKFLELPIDDLSGINGLAFVMDLRETDFLKKYPPVFKELTEKGCSFEIIFLEADENTLVRRYSQTRRHHPLSHSGSPLEGIRTEKRMMTPLKNAADIIINTSDYTVHNLKSAISDIAEKKIKTSRMMINIISFGFKYGIPKDVDLMVDVRFLPNPYFVPDLKNLTGEDEQVKNFVFSAEETQVFLEKYCALLDYLIPLYKREGKSYLTIGIGCTGGRHRSVALSSALHDHILEKEKNVRINHRDISQPQS